MKWSSIKKYIRELSVVFLGVIATLYITNKISERNEQRQLKQQLEAVKLELADNIETLDGFIAFFDDTYKLKNIFRSGKKWEDIPQEERKYYNNQVRGVVKHFNYKHDAFDMLKATGNLRLIENKELLLDITKCYSKMETARNMTNDYMNVKRNVIWNNYNGDFDKAIALVDGYIMNVDGMHLILKSSKTQIEKVLTSYDF